MQTVWKGSLSFGLVNVPVALVGTTTAAGIKFRQLHKEDKAPIKLERKCTKDGAVVPWKDLVKGAEVSKDTFVVLTEEELAEAEPESSRTLSIREFVSASDVDPVYHERSYALAPQAGGERAYALLHDAMSRRNEVAVGKLAIRDREHLVNVRAGEKLLFVDILHYADEVRDLHEIEAQVAREGNITSEESELADVLLERLHKAWDPRKYKDDYEERLRALIAAKARGETYHAPAPAKAAPTTDLLAALRATLAAESEESAPQQA